MTLSELFSQFVSSRLPRSKAALDALWIAGYSQGFAHAMQGGALALRETIRTAAIEETLQNLAPTHVLYTASNATLRPVVELLKKREELTTRATESRGAEGEKYKHYVVALDWALSAVDGH